MYMLWLWVILASLLLLVVVRAYRAVFCFIMLELQSSVLCIRLLAYVIMVIACLVRHVRVRHFACFCRSVLLLSTSPGYVLVELNVLNSS